MRLRRRGFSAVSDDAIVPPPTGQVLDVFGVVLGRPPLHDGDHGHLPSALHGLGHSPLALGAQARLLRRLDQAAVRHEIL